MKEGSIDKWSKSCEVQISHHVDDATNESIRHMDMHTWILHLLHFYNHTKGFTKITYDMLMQHGKDSKCDQFNSKRCRQLKLTYFVKEKLKKDTKNNENIKTIKLIPYWNAKEQWNAKIIRFLPLRCKITNARHWLLTVGA